MPVNEVVVQAWVTRETGGNLQFAVPGQYVVRPEFEAGAITYDRLQAESRFVDGAVTVMRRKQQGSVQLAVDVIAPDFLTLQQRKQTLVDAFTQDEFEFYLQFDTALYGWRGEAADWSVSWGHVYIHNKRLTLTFAFPVNPQPLYGVS